MKMMARARCGVCARGLFILCPSLLVLLLGSTSSGRETGAPSFAIEVDKPYEEVVAVVNEVAHTSVIKGTFEYWDEEELTGAEFAENVRWFAGWSGAGKVFYKVRRKVLSPSHFINSNDVGTVGVRYVVQGDGTHSTRLLIDAVFVENARHHWHASDGYVETCEFAEIGKRLQEYERLRAEGSSGPGFSTSHESFSRGEGAPRGNQAAVEVADNQAGDLQRMIAEQKSVLETERAQLEQLEAQARQLRRAEYVRVSAERAELRVMPYTHARMVEALKKGQEVTILARSHAWYQVRAEDGQQGWVAQTLLEAQP
jgi:SH3 domain-containing protein